MNNKPETGSDFRFLILFLSFVPLLIHLYTNAFAGYGYFRDELYYFACSNRLDLGYVDQPPLSIYFLFLSRNIFGDSIFALRMLPAVISAVTVFITALMTIKLGGKKFAIVISSVAVIFAPVYLGMNSYFSMNSFDILLWTTALYIIVLIVKENKFSYWIFLGFVIGFGLLNKIGFLWLGFGFFAGLLVTDKRKLLLTSKPYITALIALVIFVPYIIWNIKNNFAHLEFIQNATSGKYSGLNIANFIKGQFLSMNPFSAFIWIPGLYYLLFDREGKKFRLLAIIYIASFLILVLNGHSKAEYLAPAYPALFAGGGVLIERISSVKLRWLKYAVISFVVISGIMFSPLAIPILPVEAYIEYSRKLGIHPSSSESKKLSELPQFYADMFGWEEMASDVSNVYLSLTENERKRAIVFGRNYGEAASIEFFKNKYPLPPAISGHNSYWIWGFDKVDDPVLIIIGGDKEDHLKFFENVEEAGIHKAGYSMPYENDLPIFIARHPKLSLSDAWLKIKHYD
ncbi:MAG: glycosyltransferase family 39 protein [Ignavibacteria bacterium]